MNYREIHIWEFPPARTFIHLDDKFRERLFLELREKIGVDETVKMLNQSSINYCKRTYRYNSSHFYDWKRGFKNDKNHVDRINIPLWVLIEISKILSGRDAPSNRVMRDVEKHVSYYTGRGGAIPVTKPRLPMLVTPEMVSVMFHLCGDGHVGVGTDNSQYRQVDTDNLEAFILKLQNTFGKFRVSVFEDSKLIIPRIITDFYRHYFGLSGRSWDTARIPECVKAMPKNFLVAGLAAFIVDEGHVGDHVEIYSKNCGLINDIAEVTIKIGYEISRIERKYRYGKFDSFRFLIRPKSLCSMQRDLNRLEREFPTCGLSSKSGYLKQIVRARERGWKRREFGETKDLIVKFLETPSTSRSIAVMSNIKISSAREHLLQLERKNLIKRAGKRGGSILWTYCEKVD